MADATWKRIDSLVRPQRFALLINQSPYWHHTIQRAIETFTQLWGGAGFIIIPTDGNTIAAKFWEILESYSPDYLGSYKTTLRDLKWANPDAYNLQTDQIRQNWVSQGISQESADQTIREQDTNIHINELRLSDELEQELLDRLSPFHFSRIVDRHHVYARTTLNYPFTLVKNILPHSNNKPPTIYRHKELAEPVFNLMAKMRSGAITEEFEDDLQSSGIGISGALSNIPDMDYLNVIERGEGDRLSRILAEGDSTVPEDILECLPNALSMIGLGKYFRLEPGRQEREYVTVVVGDKLEDFCFAFSLTKMLNNVHWMPDKQLAEAYRDARRIRANREAGGDLEEEGDNTKIVRNLATTYSQKIGYGHYRDKKIAFTSMSLSKAQLRSRRQKVQSLAYVGVTGWRAHTIIQAANEVDVSYIARLLEANNYANEQTMAFVDNEGMERIRPIKPKHFSHIDAQNHRWIQTIQVNGFYPPPLPALGNDILNNHESRHEVRVGKDGISFMLPGTMFFVGNDIDTTLQSPEPKLLTSAEIFAHYFAGKYLVVPSDKGKYFDDTVDKFGTLDEAAKFFVNKKYGKLLKQFTEKVRDDEKTRRDERIYLEYTSRAYLDLKAVRKALGRKVNASNLVDYLLSIRVLRRGLILHCNKCSCSAWYDSDTIGQDFECVRCRTRQMILKENWKSPDEPSWYYSLAETVHQFYRNNGHITLLALKHIKGNSRNFQYLPEMELHELKDNGKKFEIDIACIKDGYIYLGEAKNRQLVFADLARNGDLRKYLKLYSEMQPKPHRIVLATNWGVVPSAVRARLKSSVGSDTMYILHKDLYGD